MSQRTSEKGATMTTNQVTLREVTAETVRAICRLSVREDQRGFVASNAVSIAQAHFSDHAWFRAIYSGDTPVGFAMIEDRPEKTEYFLWRFMIDAEHQGQGVGRMAVELLIDHVKGRPGAPPLLHHYTYYTECFDHCSFSGAKCSWRIPLYLSQWTPRGCVRWQLLRLRISFGPQSGLS